MSHLPRRTAAALLAGGALLVGCTQGVEAPSATGTTAAIPTPTSQPPTACLLDVEAFGAATGLTWTPDTTTASDTRCVYDPAGADHRDFVAVDLAPPPDTAGLNSLAEACERGTRTEVAADGAFVCRVRGGSLFAAAATGRHLVTITASAVPAGTTAQRLADALAAELTRLGRG